MRGVSYPRPHIAEQFAPDDDGIIAPAGKWDAHNGGAFADDSEHSLGGVVRRLFAAGGDGKVGDAAIQRRADLAQFGDGFFIAQQRSAFALAFAESGAQQVGGCVQINNGAALSHEGAIFGAQNRAAAGGNDHAVVGEDFAERLRFQIAESFLAVLGEDVGDGFSGVLADVFIGVGEAESEGFGGGLSDGAFSGAHHSDQNQVVAHGCRSCPCHLPA